MSSEQELQEFIKAQHEVIDTQAQRIGDAVDLLEDLVFIDENLADKVEHIIKVLMDGQ